MEGRWRIEQSPRVRQTRSPVTADEPGCQRQIDLINEFLLEEERGDASPAFDENPVESLRSDALHQLRDINSIRTESPDHDPFRNTGSWVGCLIGGGDNRSAGTVEYPGPFEVHAGREDHHHRMLLPPFIEALATQCRISESEGWILGPDSSGSDDDDVCPRPQLFHPSQVGVSAQPHLLSIDRRDLAVEAHSHVDPDHHH